MGPMRDELHHLLDQLPEAELRSEEIPITGEGIQSPIALTLLDS